MKNLIFFAILIFSLASCKDDEPQKEALSPDVKYAKITVVYKDGGKETSPIILRKK